MIETMNAEELVAWLQEQGLTEQQADDMLYLSEGGHAEKLLEDRVIRVYRDGPDEYTAKVSKISD